MTRATLLVALGMVLLVVGARWMVAAATSFARTLGVSDLVVGLTVVAVGTSLPEAAASVVAAARGQRDMAVGNAVGSNIFNVLLVQGVVALFYQPFDVASSLLRMEFPLMLGFSFFLLLLLYRRPQVHRWQGIVLLLAYLGFIWLKVG